MVSTILGTSFAALSFAGAGFLFKSLDSGGYGDEMKRHNLAMENLARARDRWNKDEIKQRDKIQRLRAELSDAMGVGVGWAGYKTYRYLSKSEK